MKIGRLSRIAGAAFVYVIAAVLMYTGILKALDHETFRNALESHGVVPQRWGQVLVWLVPSIEIVSGGAVVAFLVAKHRWVPVVAALLAGLLGAFAVYAMIVMRSSPSPGGDCGCGLPEALGTTWEAIAGRSAILCIAVALCSFSIRGFGRDGGVLAKDSVG